MDGGLFLRNKLAIPVLLSGAHLHPTVALVAELFGDDPLTVKRRLALGPCYVYRERVTIAGPRGTEISVALLGPWRDEAQLELSPSQCRALGVDAPFRQSGQLDDTPGFWVRGPAGRVYVPRGAIIAERHAHIRRSLGMHAERITAWMTGYAGVMPWDVPVKYGDYERDEIHFDKEIGESLFGQDGATAWVMT